MLSASRRGGFGALPIPISEIKAYVEFRHSEFDLDERMQFLGAIQALDGKFLELSRELGEKGEGKGRERAQEQG